MAENGILDYQGMNQAIYRGATSNIVVDTQSMSIEIGAGNASHTSNLHFECNHDANVASIRLNSNVTTEFSRSKKLIKYPRVALTSGPSGLNSGYTQDGYTVQVSSEFSTSDIYHATYAFDNEVIIYSWISGENTYSSSDGTAANATSPDTFQTINGSWIGIQLPEKIRLEYFNITNRESATLRNADSGILWAKNATDSTWYRIHDFSGLNTSSSAINTIHVTQRIAYDEYRLQITKMITYTNTGPAVSIGEWQLFGVPEYDPEAYGTDVTIKSKANVPNTDWLEVYYDAKGETTMPDPVPDLAGGDQNATVSGVTLNNEAFVFNGSSYLETSVSQITTGQWPFTMSFWFKVNEHIGSTWNYLAHLGNRQGTAGDSTLVGLQNDQISFTTWGDSKINSGIVATPGVWYHVTSTWPGGAFYDNAKLYIDAVSYGDTDNTRNEANPLNFSISGNKLTLGKQMNTTSDYFNGSIANFRLFNRALSQDEIYQLYAYQKEYFSYGDLSMTLKAGRLGIGTSEPRAALDVRGDIIGGCPVFVSAWCSTGPATNSNGVPKTIVWNKVTSSKGGGYDSSTGIFTAPLPGYYRFYYTARCVTTQGCWLRVYVNNAYIEGDYKYHTVYLPTNGEQSGNEIIVKLEQGHDFRVVFMTTNGQTSGIADNYNGFNGQYISSL